MSDWLALDGDLDGYEVHATEERVRSWKLGGKSTRRRTRPREMKPSVTPHGTLFQLLASGRNVHFTAEKLRVLAVAALPATSSATAWISGADMVAPAEPAEATPPGDAAPAWALAFMVRVEELLETLATTEAQTQALGELRTTGGGLARAGATRDDKIRNGKGAPWEMQHHQVMVCVAATSAEFVARAIGVDKRHVKQVIDGRRRSVDDPSLLDRLYTAIRSDMLDGEDDVYDAMTTSLIHFRRARRRAEVEHTAWGELP